jgi:hypothetical protein
MYRDIRLEGRVMLELTVFYLNGFDGLSGYSVPFVAPRSMTINAGPNQQFRVDLLAPTAGADSIADGGPDEQAVTVRPNQRQV